MDVRRRSSFRCERSSAASTAPASPCPAVDRWHHVFGRVRVRRNLRVDIVDLRRSAGSTPAFCAPDFGALISLIYAAIKV
jgi:hypothetical protein